MNLETWKISGTSFHFGRHGLGLEENSIHLTSDTLFSALAASLVQMEGAAALAPWTNLFSPPTPGLAFTSAYPRAGEIRFFPTPLRTAEYSGSNQVPAKKLKKVAYISEKLFLQILCGASLQEILIGALELQGGSLLVSQAEKSQLPETLLKENKIWEVESRPRVRVDRSTAASNLFHIGHTTFAPECGLWFGVLWTTPAPAVKKQLERLFTHLGDSGLGGDRSSGFGAAEITPGADCVLPDHAGTTWVSLSHFLPAIQDMPALMDDRAAYNVQVVGGWANSPGKKPQRRRTVRMLAEGSVFGPLPTPIPGELVDVQPDYNDNQPFEHPVWRCGLTVPAGIALATQKKG